MKKASEVYTVSKDKKVVNCDILGAMFLSKNTGEMKIKGFPSIVGLIKIEGCVEFEPARALNEDNGLMIYESECMDIYYAECPHEEAWLVVPAGKNWHWYRRPVSCHH